MRPTLKQALVREGQTLNNGTKIQDFVLVERYPGLLPNKIFIGNGCPGVKYTLYKHSRTFQESNWIYLFRILK